MIRNVFTILVRSGLLTGLLCHSAITSAGAQVPTASGKSSLAIRSVLQKNCLGCHGVGASLSGLDLRTRETAIKGGLHGAAIVPGSATKSLLYQMVIGQRTPKMPPNARLTDAEIGAIRAWIDSGANFGAAIATADKQTWWSFKPLVLPHVPVLKLPSTLQRLNM